MARKSRNQQRSKTETEARRWQVAAYIRLSREDGGGADESESVSNQRAIIKKHLEEMEDGDAYTIVKEYVDDGVSGTTDDERDSFQEMLEDIRLGLVNCVIVKDLARSFRNYSDQGYYLDDWFPRHRVRFISLFHQPLDSYREPRAMRSIAVPIQGVMNENHCAETSDKVRQVFDMKRRSGQHIGSFAPYGYAKHPGDHNRLVVDQMAAEVIREVFDQFLAGKSKRELARNLNDRGVLCPSAYKRETLQLAYQNPSLDPLRRPLWSAVSIDGILKNRLYCGDMVQGRYRKKSYKIHLQERVPEESWFVVENTHEAIIDRHTFAEAQRLLQRDTRTPKGRKGPYLFGGMLHCADCGKAMSRSEVKGHVYYFCRTYKDQSKRACSRHSIKEDHLVAAVLSAVQGQIRLGVSYEKAMETVRGAPVAGCRSERKEERILQEKRARSKLLAYQQAAWQDWKDGALSKEAYLHMRQDYEGRIGALTKRLDSLEAEANVRSDVEEKADELLAEFQREKTVKHLTRDLLFALVEDIRIYEGGKICICFSFVRPDSASAGKRLI